MYVFLAGSLLLGGLFSNCGEWGYSLGVVRGLLVAERGLSCMGSVVEFPGSRAQAQ